MALDMLEDLSDRMQTATDPMYVALRLIIAKCQGNFETLSDAPGNTLFLFKAKCPVIADHVNLPLGTHILK